MTRLVVVLCGLVLLAGCGGETGEEEAAEKQMEPAAADERALASNATRNAYFGDLHVHTKYSFDAYIFGTRADPDDAYEFAKGAALAHPAGFDMRLEEPLDFYGVSDHGAYLGILPAMGDPSTEISEHPDAETLTQHDSVADRGAAFQSLRQYIDPDSDKFMGIQDDAEHEAAWAKVVEAANRHNDPGEFTAFIAYEYTSGPKSQNLHRNVVFAGDKAPAAPFTRLMSQNPEKLWEWMDNQRDAGMDAIAIPHNMNGSNGQMFALNYFDSERHQR